MGFIIKSEKEELSGYTSDFWECIKRAKQDGYNDDLAKAWCERIYG